MVKQSSLRDPVRRRSAISSRTIASTAAAVRASFEDRQPAAAGRRREDADAQEAWAFGDRAVGEHRALQALHPLGL